MFGSWEDKLRKIADELPIGVYRVDKDGNFIFCNKIVRQILGIPLDERDIRKYNLRNYYARPDEREKLLGKMREAGGQLTNETLSLVVNGQEIYVWDNCRFVYDRKGNEVGCLGIFTDVTEVIEYQKLIQQFDELNAGIYQIDTDADGNDKWVRANRGAARIFGFHSVKELMEYPVKKLYQDENDLKKFKKELEEKGELTNWLIDMRRQGGEEIIVQVTAKAIRDPESGKLIGRYGTFMDVTKEQRYFRALANLPTGYYHVDIQKEKEIITDCNKKFAEMFEFDGPESVKGRVDITKLYANPKQDWPKFKMDLEEVDRKGEMLKNYRLKVKGQKGKEFWILIDCRLLRDRKGNIIGREGTVRDITEQVELEQEVQKLQEGLKRTTQDMDHFMHRYIAPMMRLDAALQVQANILAATRPQASPQDEVKTLTEVWASELEAKLSNTIEQLKSEDDKAVLRDRLQVLSNRLAQRKFLGSPVLEDVCTREIALEVLQAIKPILEVSRRDRFLSSVQQLSECANKILDEALLRSTKRLRAETAALNTVIESLRNYLRREKVKYDFKECSLARLLQGNMEIYAPMAAEKGLTFRYKGKGQLLAEVAETHVDRMISNLLLNAIKYSYKRPDGFILIETSEDERNVEIKVTNYGVPIAKDELEGGMNAKIFEYGYRGCFSKDWNRTGSGVGLADIKETVEKHSGTIEVKSHPASPEVKEDDYTVPFLTTVTVVLPKHQSRGGESYG